MKNDEILNASIAFTTNTEKWFWCSIPVLLAIAFFFFFFGNPVPFVVSSQLHSGSHFNIIELIATSLYC